MSKSTLVSIVPFPITEFKPGIYPGKFEIKGSKEGIPELLVISDSIYHVEIDENRTITVTCQSEKLAESIVEDYIISNLAFSRELNATPGVFWVPEVQTLGSILANFSKQLEKVKIRQDNWFKRLVTIADDDWEKTRQHKTISDMQRYAAKSLGLERPWIINAASQVQAVGQAKCIGCSSVVSLEAIVCPHCRCILKPEAYKTLQFAEVK